MQWSAIVAWLDAFDASFCLLQPIGNNDQSKRVYIYRMIFGAVNGHIFFPECCCSWKASFPSRSSWIDVFIEHVFLYLYSWMLIHKLLYISQANDQFYWIPEIFEVSTNIEANIIFHWHWYEYSLCKCTEHQIWKSYQWNCWESKKEFRISYQRQIMKFWSFDGMYIKAIEALSMWFYKHKTSSSVSKNCYCTSISFIIVPRTTFCVSMRIGNMEWPESPTASTHFISFSLLFENNGQC